MKKILTVLTLSLTWITLFAQTTLQFRNPSFEGVPQAGAYYIVGWTDCSSWEFEGESPVDLQPGFFKVDMAPVDGSTHLGMVTKAYGVYESVSQEFDFVFLEDSIYQFSIYLARSDEYASPMSSRDPLYVPHEEPKYVSRQDRKVARKNGFKINSPTTAVIDSVEYNESCILRVWSGSSICSKEELLFETSEIDHSDWQAYDIQFRPTVLGLNVISLEAYYPYESTFTRGNLMLDFIHE